MNTGWDTSAGGGSSVPAPGGLPEWLYSREQTIGDWCGSLPGTALQPVGGRRAHTTKWTQCFNQNPDTW